MTINEKVRLAEILNVIQDSIDEIAPLAKQRRVGDDAWAHFYCIIIENNMRLCDFVLEDLGIKQDDLANELEARRKARENGMDKVQG